MAVVHPSCQSIAKQRKIIHKCERRRRCDECAAAASFHYAVTPFTLRVSYSVRDSPQKNRIHNSQSRHAKITIQRLNNV